MTEAPHLLPDPHPQSLPARGREGAALTLYDSALKSLSEAVRIDEVLSIHDGVQRLKAYAKRAKDPDLMAKAIELKMRSERSLGGMLIAAKNAGQIGDGRPRKDGQQNPSDGARFSRVTLAEAGIDYKLSANSQKLAGVAEQSFETLIAEARDKVFAGRAAVINPLKDLSTRDKQLRRRIREAQLAAKQRALPQKRFGVIYADPEWEFKTRSEAGMDRAAENHYPTSTTEVIATRPVGKIAAEDCALFLWATVPMLPEALQVMGAWGFKYKSGMAWDKVEPGQGFWFRNQHELLLLGTRGNVPAPAFGTQWNSLIAERKRGHSEKPDWAYELIEAYFPNLPKIELNARTRRDGWDAWGFEAPEDDERDDEAPPLLQLARAS